MSTLLILLKAPRRGYVKTRLAYSTGHETALQVYRQLVTRQLTALPSDSEVEVHYAPQDARLEMQEWLGDRYRYYPQTEGELGARIEHAVEGAFQRGAKSVICIGGDCPMLNRTHFVEAEELLNAKHDVVFGPSEDGGYYLIALTKPHPQLFQNIAWSTHTTLKTSLDIARNLQLKVGFLETLYDIDEVDELKRAISDKLVTDVEITDRHYRKKGESSPT